MEAFDLLFFNKRKKEKQHQIIRFSDVESITIETEKMHFELLPGECTVKYRNVISPTSARMSFPDGFFNERESRIPNNTMNLISASFDQLFTRTAPEDHLDILPPGAARDAYMGITLARNTVYYYTNTHTTTDGFQVKTDPIADEFIQIVQLLKPICSFPSVR